MRWRFEAGEGSPSARRFVAEEDITPACFWWWPMIERRRLLTVG